MTRLLWRIAVIEFVVLGALVLLTQGQAWDGKDVWATLETPRCALPCYLGIRPDLTSGSDAYTTLQTHPWVATIIPDYGKTDILNQDPDVVYVFDWRWNGKQPNLLRTPYLEAGEVDVETNVVRVIKVRTEIPFAAIWLTLGQPEYGFTQVSKNLLGRFANQFAYYPARGVAVQTLVNYPLSFDAFWNAPVDLYLMTKMPPGGHYQAPCWMQCDE